MRLLQRQNGTLHHEFGELMERTTSSFGCLHASFKMLNLSSVSYVAGLPVRDASFNAACMFGDVLFFGFAAI